jgi:hypothetical protein
MDNFGLYVCPRHTNLAQFQPVKDFVAIDIDPLCYSNDYVEQGVAEPRLKCDLLFVATRMGLECAQGDSPRTSGRY